MFWQQSAQSTQKHSNTLRAKAQLKKAVSLALFASVGGLSISGIGMTLAHAANIGATSVQSTQHQPLKASITVTDIDADNFSASLAGRNVYSQMGLKPTDTMSVRFVPTGKTSGRIVISTSAPVSAPFADVVLAVNDNGQKKVIPKTLLMPIGNTAKKADIAPNKAATAAAKPNLPEVSGEPLVVKRTAPPPLTPSKSSKSNNKNKPDEATGAKSTEPPMSATAADKQMEVLSVQVIRKVRPQGASQATVVATTTDTVSKEDLAKPNESNSSTATSIVPSTPALAAKVKPNTSNAANNNVTKNKAKKATNTTTSAKKASPAKKQPTSSQNTGRAQTSAAIKSSGVTYTVQRNDNLWTIAEQLAVKNNLDVATVMRQIQAQNPDAFIDSNVNLLKANAKLDLPDYDVVPSQQSLQAAVSARRAELQRRGRSGRASTGVNKPNNAPTRDTAANNNAIANNKVANNKAASNKPKPATVITKALPKARMSVIAPGVQGRADGTQTKASAPTGSGISTDMLATLKTSRLRTATQAKRVREVNNTLAAYTKKLQLQNQRLAELEARLKELRKN